ncbi:NACHT domain-containing protein [Streptomyces sp. NPDC058694]|uniref:NACHT domain-containing protein n=1 Tax=Streptomyces sp. NPDC058694 TaxID=3346603 RepID=UPI00364B9244
MALSVEGAGLGASESRREALAELKERLRTLRVQRRLSMTALPGRAGLGRTTVSQALNGTGIPSEATVVALASALKTDAEPLLRLRARALPPAARVATADDSGSSADPSAEANADADADADAHSDVDSASDPLTRFESWYRSYLEQRYGQLSVIGLDLSRPERACWPLDAAYLSLELAAPVRGVGSIGNGGGIDIAAGPRGGGLEVRVERAEQALAGQRRTLVRGLAGSGKTTLLQWLAVSTARRSLPPELAHLEGCLPFVLPLRTLVRRGELPAPHEYLTAVGCPRDSAQPANWADRALVDGRALLLIDGLDEVPQAQRARTRQWLRELLAAYPRAAYLVTTRPSAVPEGWLADSGFTELTVRPMSTRDVAVFVSRWHTAAASNATSDQERAHLATLEETLKDTVRSQRDLARLTTTPLLCALVCALHRDRRGHLPHGRMALYEAALSMLMHRRDRERDIEAPEGLSLTEHQSVQLLQRLAYWLIRNGQTELDHDTARALVDDALPAMPHIAQQADADGVLTHLLARSGLLRQPTAETIDFVHRTFQDYLGAKAAIEARDIPLLVRHAHDDQWEDVLRMAVAHARPHERASLLRRLITRGDRTPKHRTRLHLLATACLEHATELDPAVREDVEQRTAALLPPRSDDEARTLAAVGPVILDLLPGPEGLEDDEAEAVVTTAGLIGGDAALTVMKKFRASTNVGVQATLHDDWSNFDTEDYAHEVLAHVPGADYVAVRSAEQLSALRHLRTSAHVTFTGNFTSSEITNAIRPEELRRLGVTENSVLDNVGFLQAYTSLTDISFSQCPNVADLTPLAATAVTSLYLYECEATRIDDLQVLTGLKSLSLNLKHPLRSLETLPVGADLTSLWLGSLSCGRLGTLEGITRWPNLTTLSLCSPVNGFSQVSALPKLNHLVLQLRAGLSMLAELPPAPQIEELWLGGSEAEDDLAMAARALPNLKKLTIFCYRNPRRVDLTPLRGMADLAIIINRPGEVLGTEHFPPGAITRKPRPRT